MRRSICFLGMLSLAFLQPASATTQLIANGAFAGTSSAPWKMEGLGISIPPGGGYLSMGNASGKIQETYQTIAFPANLIGATLSLQYQTLSTDPNGDDSLTIYLTDTNFNVLIDFGTVSSSNPTSGYVELTDTFITYAGQNILSSYAGQKVNLLFYVTTDATDGSLTSFDITDVSLVAATTADIPFNDNFANALSIPLPGITNSVNTTYASREPGELYIGGNSGGHSLWWTWTAPAIGTVTISTAGSAFNTLLGVYTGTSLADLTPVASSDGFYLSSGLANVKFGVSAGTQYKIALDGYNGWSGSALFAFSFLRDTTPPMVAIKSPKSGTDVTSPIVLVGGTASDNVSVAGVYYQLRNANGTNAWQLAVGVNSWSVLLTNLVLGANTVRVEAYDTSSNVSALASCVLNYVIPEPLHLTVIGSGTVGAMNGQLFNLGYPYNLTAKAAPGFVFQGWTGDISTSSKTLNFTMTSNLSLTASFIPNPFIPAAGSYQGLFFDTNEAALASSGFFSALVSSNGGFTAKFQQGNKSYSFAGQFSLTGFWSTNALKVWNNTAITLQLDLQGGDMLQGTLINQAWTAELAANRAVFAGANHAPQAGKYTLILPGTNSPTLPGGNGFGALTVGIHGGVTFGGTLGDGTQVMQSATESGQGQWPFYLSIAGGKGMILGWLAFTNEPDRDIDGTLSWFKPSQPAAAAYRAGFTNQLQAVGSAYLHAAGEQVLNLTNGYALLENGGLSPAISNLFTLKAKNMVAGSNKLHLTLTAANGLFQGSATNAQGKPISFSGAVLQKQTNGFGQFLNAAQTGSVYLAPPSP